MQVERRQQHAVRHLSSPPVSVRWEGERERRGTCSTREEAGVDGYTLKVYSTAANTAY